VKKCICRCLSITESITLVFVLYILQPWLFHSVFWYHCLGISLRNKNPGRGSARWFNVSRVLFSFLSSRIIAASECTFSTIIHLPKGLTCGPDFLKITDAESMDLYCIKLLIKKEKAELQYLKRFVCLFSWRYKPLWLYSHSPVAGFSLLVFEVS